MSNPAARQLGRAIRQLGGRHEGTRDATHLNGLGVAAGAAPTTLQDGSWVGIVGLSVLDGNWVVGPAGAGIVGRSIVGRGDYAGEVPGDNVGGE